MPGRGNARERAERGRDRGDEEELDRSGGGRSPNGATTSDPLLRRSTLHCRPDPPPGPCLGAAVLAVNGHAR